MTYTALLRPSGADSFSRLQATVARHHGVVIPKLLAVGKLSQDLQTEGPRLGPGIENSFRSQSE